jgi:hypothetical protein
MPQRFLRYRRIGIKSYQVSIRKNFGAEFGTIMAPSWHHHGTMGHQHSHPKVNFVAVSIVQVWASLGDSHHAMC